MDEKPNGHSNGSANGLLNQEDEEMEEAPLPPAPPRIAELVAACVRFVQGKYGVPLDGTSDTLSLVDQYVREARSEIALLPSSLDLIGNAVGAYLGEVIRQTFGGAWEAEGDPSSYRLFFSRVKLATNPLGIGRESVTMTDEPGWHAHLDVAPNDRVVLESALASLPEVDEEEYYLPSTRFDFTQTVFDLLRAKMVHEERGHERYTVKDYKN